MVMIVGIRLAGYAVVAATAIITHDSTKRTTKKFYKWAKDKFTRRSPPDTDVVHHSDDDDAPQPFPSHAQHTNERQQTPPHSVHVAVSPDDLTVDAPQVDDNKLSRAASDAASATPEEEFPSDSEQPKPPHSLLARAADNAVNQDNLTALAPHADDNQLTIFAVESETDGSDGASDAVIGEQPAGPEATLTRGAPDLPPAFEIDRGASCADSGSTEAPVGPDEPPGKLDPAQAAGILGFLRAAAWVRGLFHWGGTEAPVVPDEPPDEPPDPAPAAGILGSVRAAVGAAAVWARRLFHWAGGHHESAGPDTPGLAERILEPKTLNKIGRISKKILWLTFDTFVLDVLKRNRVWRDIYRIVKNEFS